MGSRDSAIDYAGPVWRYALVGIVAMVVWFAGMSLREWWHRRSEDRAMRQSAIAACVPRLGSEGVCAAHDADFGEECARITRHYPTRLSPGPSRPDPAAFLDCMVLGDDAWREQLRALREKNERAARHRYDAIP
jgi:hypothetical protein